MKENRGMLHAVFSVMSDGHWRTLAEIKRLLDHDYSEAGISARLRDFRKKEYALQFGVEKVERRLRAGSARLHEYRVLREPETLFTMHRDPVEEKRAMQTRRETYIADYPD